MCMCNNPKNINAPLVPETWTVSWRLSSHQSGDGFVPALLQGPRLEFDQPVKTRTGHEVESFQSDLSQIFSNLKHFLLKQERKSKNRLVETHHFFPDYFLKSSSSNVTDNFTADQQTLTPFQEAESP